METQATNAGASPEVTVAHKLNSSYVRPELPNKESVKSCVIKTCYSSGLLVFFADHGITVIGDVFKPLATIITATV